MVLGGSPCPQRPGGAGEQCRDARHMAHDFERLFEIASYGTARAARLLIFGTHSRPSPRSPIANRNGSSTPRHRTDCRLASGDEQGRRARPAHARPLARFSPVPGTDADVDDLVQETFIRLSQRGTGFRGQCNFALAADDRRQC